MKKLLYTLFLLTSFFGFGQCPTLPYTFNSQAQVDAFAANFPGCTNLLADITISGSDITSLSGLSQLVSTSSGILIFSNELLVDASDLDLDVSSTSSSTMFMYVSDNPVLTTLPNLNQGAQGIDGIAIVNNPNLPDLNGFIGLTSIASIYIEECHGLISLAGLNNITFLDSFQIIGNNALQSISELANFSGDLNTFRISSNPQLSSLNGLEGVLNTGVSGQMIISNNDSLLNLDGLQNVTGGFGLWITTNDALQSFEGLNSVSTYREIVISSNLVLDDISNFETNLSSQITSLTIVENPNLAICSLNNICTFLGNGGGSVFENNAQGCNSTIEVIENCTGILNVISGNIKYDFDSDGCNPTDINMDSTLVVISDGVTSYGTVTNEMGDYYIPIVGEGTFTTTVDNDGLPGFFEATPASVETTFVGFGNIEQIDFCISATDAINDLRVSLLPLGDARPGFNSEYQLVYENVGSTLLSGTVALEFDDIRQTYMEATPSEDNIIGNLITWNYTDLLPFQIKTIDVSFNNFPPPINNSDDILVFEATINPIADDENPDDNIYTFEQIIVNSFDPNDKRVVQGAEIEIDEVGNYLDYIVRFQNTGTADAINVRVEDVLDGNLQLETFRMLSSSHTYRVEIINGNEIAFIFENIILPPEVIDPEGSNGFIAFQVRTDQSLQIGDTVENTASIFFDFNPPIVTNTVVTTVVENLSVTNFDLNDAVSIYPNPASEILFISASENIKVKEVMVYSVLSKLLLITSENSITVSSLSEGIYFIQVETDQGSFTRRFIVK
jgi:uncharacterized repeat protein (TIGR01451 family)